MLSALLGRAMRGRVCPLCLIIVWNLSSALGGCGDAWRVREDIDLEPIVLEPIHVCQTPARTPPAWIPEAAIRVLEAQPAAAPAQPPSEAPPTEAALPVEQSKVSSAPESSPCIDLNTAPAEVLVTLPGVGPSRAQQIVEARTRRPFEKTRHITRIRGIGPATYRKMRDMLCPVS